MFQALDVDVYNGNVAEVQSFINGTGVTFPVLRNAGYLVQPGFYGLQKDNYVVIDKDGIVRYTSANEVFVPLGHFNDAHLRAAIHAWLPLGVEPRTWAGVKGLYR